MPKIEFKHSGLPKNADEMKETLEEIRAAVHLGGEATDEVMVRITDVIKQSVESVETAKRAEQIAKDAAEIAKAAQRDGRASDDRVERQLKALPFTFDPSKDEDFSQRGISIGHFNVIQFGDDELRLALGDEAYAAAKRLRKLNDHLLTADTILRAQSGTRNSYMDRGGMKSLRLYEPYKELAATFKRALDTATAGGASEWAPTGYSADLMSDVRDQLTFARTVDWLPMPQNPWQYPILKAFMTSYLAGQATSDAQAATYTASDVTSAGSLLTAKKHTALTWLSKEQEADSIFPIVPKLNNEIAYAIAYGWDHMFCNGQLTAAIDTAAAIAASDVRNGGDGFRYGAKQTGKQADFAGSLTVEGLASLIGKIGKYADRCFFASGYSGLARALVLKDAGGNSVLLTLEKAGSSATMLTGTVGVLLGRPFVIGGVYPENMNSSGIVDGVAGSTKTGVHCVNPNMYLGGLRQSVQVEANYNPGWLADQLAIKGSARVALSPAIAPSSTYKFVAEGVNIPSYV